METALALLLIWVAFFAAVIYWAYAPSRRHELDAHALIPFRED
jgi:cbb3-type cytochrome oxidase subunit 3